MLFYKFFTQSIITVALHFQFPRSPHQQSVHVLQQYTRKYIVHMRATLRRGVAKDLEVPFWARDASEVGVDRSMDLPCYGAKLKKD